MIYSQFTDKKTGLNNLKKKIQFAINENTDILLVQPIIIYIILLYVFYKLGPVHQISFRQIQFYRNY